MKVFTFHASAPWADAGHVTLHVVATSESKARKHLIAFLRTKSERSDQRSIDWSSIKPSINEIEEGMILE